MKKIVFLNLAIFCSFTLFSQSKKNEVYLLLEPKDNLTLIDKDQFVFLFKNKEGLHLKMKKDSIKLGLRPFFDSDQKGKVIVKEQPVFEQWIEFQLPSKFTTIQKRDLNKLNVMDRTKFIDQKPMISNFFVLRKKDNNDLYNVYLVNINQVIE